MANNNFRFQLRHGSSIPEGDQLLENELGVYTNEAKGSVYVNINGTIKRLVTPLIFYTSISLATTTTQITIANDKLYAGATVFIDLDYEGKGNSVAATAAQIKAFRKADLVKTSSTDSSLTLSVKGKIPIAATNIPLKVVVF